MGEEATGTPVSDIITAEINRILASRGIQIPEQPRVLTPAETVEAAFARVEAELRAERPHTSGSDGVHRALLAALQAVHQFHYEGGV